MTENHPITPPPELVQQWESTAYDAAPVSYTHHIARCAARWGADQELEACYAWVTNELNMPGSAICLREDRRPKPPSLKEQALELLDKAEDPSWDINDFSIIRRALEQLND